jgi:hypothetical protein
MDGAHYAKEYRAYSEKYNDGLQVCEWMFFCGSGSLAVRKHGRMFRMIWKPLELILDTPGYHRGQSMMSLGYHSIVQRHTSPP